MLKNGVKGLFVSDLIRYSSLTKRIAFIGVTTALMIVSNMLLEFKMMDIQFSITILMSFLSGVLLGSAFGFLSCVLGDAIGFLVHNAGFIYMPWVGLSMGMVAFFAGLIVNGFDFKFKGQLYLKVALVSVITFVVCSILINSTGFYYYNLKMGFSTAVIEYVASKFGSGVTYWGYVAYRMIFKGQIYNSILNYALCFIFVPVIKKIKYFNPQVVQNTDK